MSAGLLLRTMPLIVLAVLGEDLAHVPLAEDQHVVQALAARLDHPRAVTAKTPSNVVVNLEGYAKPHRHSGDSAAVTSQASRPPGGDEARLLGA